MNFLLNFDNMLNELRENKYLEENLSKIVRNIKNEIEFQSLGIFLKIRKSNHFRLKISRNISHTFKKNAILSDDEPLIKELSHFKILEINPEGKYKFEKDFVHLLIVPLYNNKVLLGFIFIDRLSSKFTESEIVKFSIYSSILSLGVSLANQRDEIEHLVKIDEITGLHNYKSFYEIANFLLSLMNRYKRDLTMAVFKINDFEDILRTFGKDIINETAREIGLILKNNLHGSDISGRIFKDTVAIAMPETSVENCVKVVKRINKLIKDIPHLQNLKIGWGISHNKDFSKSVEELLTFAEQAAFESIREREKNITIYEE
ncbi:MAG: diguanylate cyclase [Armatimonadetes bacterium]|nr:diguanylate cyclase [Armatimonadota bacterium]